MKCFKSFIARLWSQPLIQLYTLTLDFNLTLSETDLNHIAHSVPIEAYTMMTLCTFVLMSMMPKICPRSRTEKKLTNHIWIIWSRDHYDWLILSSSEVSNWFLACDTKLQDVSSNWKASHVITMSQSWLAESVVWYGLWMCSDIHCQYWQYWKIVPLLLCSAL